LKIELPYHFAIPLLGIYPKKIESQLLEGICTPKFITALSTIAEIWKQPKSPLMDEWLKRIWYR
jgi:hypothetical protein